MQDKEANRRESFCEDVNKLLMGRKIGYIDDVIRLVLANNVERNVDMFCLLMLLEIVNKTYGRLVVGEERSRIRLRITKLLEKMACPKELLGGHMSGKILSFSC